MINICSETRLVDCSNEKPMGGNTINPIPTPWMCLIQRGVNNDKLF